MDTFEPNVNPEAVSEEIPMDAANNVEPLQKTIPDVSPDPFKAPSAPIPDNAKNLSSSAKVVLAPGESIVKEWTYATAKSWFRNCGETTLTLTNKRLISTNTRGHLYQKRELPTQDIKSFSGSVTYKRFGLFIFLAIVSLFLAVISALNMENEGTIATVGAVVFFVLTALFIALFVIIKRGYFQLDVKTYKADGSSLNVYANNTGVLKNKSFRVKLDLDAATDVLDTFGVVLQQIRS